MAQPSTSPLIDCHVHLWSLETLPHLEAIRQHVGAERMSIVCVMDDKRVNENAPAFAAKAQYPGRYYLFPSLDHATHFSGGKLRTPSLVEQTDRLIALGADGIKMLEAKPTHRKMLDVPVDTPYFEAYFTHAEEIGLPLLWHVADPEEFWDPATTPRWAAERGWGYNDSFIAKEKLYAEVEGVLRRHPRLKVIFAHFFFLSADLPRAAALFERYEGVHFDLAPGIELLYNLSRDPDSAREFFTKHADRILFGTDIASDQTLAEAKHRLGIVRRWLTTDDEYRVTAEADFLLGPPEDGIMRGLKLPEEVLAKITRANFERLAGPAPRPLNRPLAIEECERLAAEQAFLGGMRVEETGAFAAAAALRS